MRRSMLILAVLASASAAHAGDRYGPGPAQAPAPRQTYGDAPMAPARLLNWNNKAAPAQGMDNNGQVRPAPLSDWARHAEAERTGRPVAPAPAPVSASRLVTPAQGQVPSSVYTRAAATPPRIADSIYTRAAAAPPAALPSSIYAPAPANGYRTPAPPTGAPIEIKPSDLPDQPTLAQQMAASEEASVMEAKIARARALEAKDRSDGVLIPSQDVVR